MLLGPVSLIDCLVFLIFLAPQIVLQVGPYQTLVVLIQILPFFCFQLPYQFVEERVWRRPADRSDWVRGASLFEDIVIRCVRYAFANISPKIAVVFFSRKVAIPFTRWRMLRHGYLQYPVYCKETSEGTGDDACQGLWMMHKPEEPPDLVLYYIHGGGFVLGSSYFYFEFLMALHHWLLSAGYRNPAVFALDYTLAPSQCYPFQLKESLAGYRQVLKTARDPSKICIAGDSAGGSLILTLLLELGAGSGRGPAQLPVPQLSVLISPWITIKTELHDRSNVDYLDRETLWAYGYQYAREDLNKAPASPGLCRDAKLWQAASPTRGFYVVYGKDEVFAPDIEDWQKRMGADGVKVESKTFTGDRGVHAWPVVSLFLSSTEERRMEGLKGIASAIRSHSPEAALESRKGK